MMPVVARTLTHRQWNDVEQSAFVAPKTKQEPGIEVHWISYTFRVEGDGTRVTHSYRIDIWPYRPIGRLYAHIQPQHLDMRPQMRQNLEALRQRTHAGTLTASALPERPRSGPSRIGQLTEPRGFSIVDIDEPRVAGVTPTVPEHSVIRDAVMLACRAPSVHNSQPWLWVAEGMALHLFANPKRLLRITDRTGREMLLSCGAVLDHLNVAMAALGWRTAVDRFPEANGHDHLATLHFSPAPSVDDSQARRADAILKRRTDRLPFAAPAGWNALVSAFRNEVSNHDVTLAVVADHDREQLAQASQLTEALRRQDPTYQSELRWWTSPFNLDEGVPASSRLSTSEAGRVDVARAFPPFGHGDRRRRVDIDHSKIVVLCTRDDSRPSVLRCGEALSAVLLECAIAGLATCTLTHIIEVTSGRDIVRRLVGETGLPQLLIRVGRAPAGEQQPPATPRLPVQDVLDFRS